MISKLILPRLRLKERRRERFTEAEMLLDLDFQQRVIGELDSVRGCAARWSCTKWAAEKIVAEFKHFCGQLTDTRPETITEERSQERVTAAPPPLGDGQSPDKARTDSGQNGSLPMDTKASPKPPDPIALELLDEFLLGLRRRMVMAKMPDRADVRARWAREIEKTFALGADPEAIRAVLTLLQDPGYFWHGKLESTKKLRERFPALYADAVSRGIAAQAPGHPPGGHLRDLAEERRVASRKRAAKGIFGE